MINEEQIEKLEKIRDKVNNFLNQSANIKAVDFDDMLAEIHDNIQTFIEEEK